MEKGARSLAKFGVRLPIYILMVGLLIFFRYRSNERSASESNLGPAEIPKIDSPSRKGAGGAGNNQGGVQAVPEKDYTARAIFNNSYPLIKLIGWNVEVGEGGVQVISALMNFKDLLQYLKWKELGLRVSKDGQDLATPEEILGLPSPQKGIRMIQFKLAKDALEFKQGFIWCWNNPLCELKPDGKWSKERMQKCIERQKTTPPEKRM